jgi:hypothetical protein
MVMKSYILWDISPCILLKDNRRFGGKYHILPYADFLLGFFFDPEDGGDVVLKNVG